jgi:hypothetical protein
MKNLRNKKRLVSLAVVFALVFMVGAAFAFSGAILVQGNVQVAGQGYVRWCENATWATGFGNVDSNFQFDPSWVTGQANKVIAWDIEFGEAGFVTLTTAARNDSGMDYAITGINVSWWSPYGWSNSNDLSELGLTVDFGGSDTAFVGATLDADGGLSPLLTIEVEWDGTVPPGFINATPPQLIGTNGVFLGEAGTLTIEFEYAPI